MQSPFNVIESPVGPFEHAIGDRLYLRDSLTKLSRCLFRVRLLDRRVARGVKQYLVRHWRLKSGSVTWVGESQLSTLDNSRGHYYPTRHVSKWTIAAAKKELGRELSEIEISAIALQGRTARYSHPSD